MSLSVPLRADWSSADWTTASRPALSSKLDDMQTAFWSVNSGGQPTLEQPSWLAADSTGAARLGESDRLAARVQVTTVGFRHPGGANGPPTNRAGRFF